MTTDPVTPQPPSAAGELPWLRLDSRMLLVHPVTEAIKFLPILIASVVVGAQSGNHMFGLIALGVVLVLACMRWFTTTYRIGPVNIELRTGLFERKLLSIPRSRIRSVDVEAQVIHRLLGLSIVRVGTGTGQGDEKFELNALASGLVPSLRAELLSGVAARATDPDVPQAQTPDIAHFSPAWVRFAPFSSTGILAILAVVGVAFQTGIGAALSDSSRLKVFADSATTATIAIAVVVLGLLLVIASTVISCVFYLLTYGGLHVVDDGRVLHVSYGLLRTRHQSLDRARLRGSTLHLPLLIRLVGGARLDAIMTGVSAEKRESSLVMPLSPIAESRRVMGELIGDTEQAVAPLTNHGKAAARRRFTRALIPAGLLALVPTGLTLSGVDVHWSAWALEIVVLVAAAGLAWDRYRGLGHAVLPGWLVTQNGSLDRKRDAIQSAGIIGWTVRQTFFQRRAGVATIVAATAAGRGHYEVIDVPVDQAWPLIEAVQPGAGDVWAQRSADANH